MFRTARQQTGQPAGRSPLSDDPEAIAAGRALFRWNCAFCHGLGAEGGIRGPDLVRRQLSHAATDRQMFDNITQGIQGTDMPGHPLPDDHVWQIVSFLNDRRSKAQIRQPAGDWDRGKQLYFGRAVCHDCHMIHGKGGRLGPNLTGIGSRSSLEDLIESIREPNAQFKTVRGFDGSRAGGYEPVTLVAKNGRKTTGVVKNEDTFVIQIMDAEENFHFATKADLSEVIRLEESMMPAYEEDYLSHQELEDLLTFLTQPPPEDQGR